jgi:hypothetical protein
MSPRDRDRLEQSRYITILLMRASGVIVMVLGLWIWNGNILRPGGWPMLGIPLFISGFLESLILPQWLAQRWRTPPER